MIELYNIGKIPPNEIELERHICASLLSEESAINIVAPILNIDCFYSPIYRAIYNAIIGLHIKSIPIDILLVAEKLKEDNKLEEIGGLYFLSEIQTYGLGANHIEAHAKKLYEKYIYRELIRISYEVSSYAYSEEVDSFKLIEKTLSETQKITKGLSSNKVQRADNIAKEVAEEIILNKGKNLGLLTGLSDLDRILYGLSPSDLIILAGGTSEGKTTLALQIGEYVSRGNNVLLFSLEMSKEQQLYKIISSATNSSVVDVRRGNIDMDKALEYTSKLNNLYIYDEGGATIGEIQSVANTMNYDKKLGLIVIDYLQLITTDKNNKIGSREQEVSYISKSLKSLAKKLKVPIIALSQLSRIDKSKPRLYRLSDLRESGAIEQDADIVLFTYRASYHGVYRLEELGDTELKDNDTVLQIAKNRLGQVGYTIIEFNGMCSRFEDKKNEYENKKWQFVEEASNDIPF